MGQTIVPKSVIRASYLEQAKLTQAHAWLGLGANGAPSKARLMQLQEDTFDITISGVDALAGSLASSAARTELIRSAVLEDAWKLSEEGDALHVAGVVGDRDNSGRYFNAEVEFRFASEPALLPAISQINIRVIGEAQSPEGKPDPMKSRLLSTNHRWHTLVEEPNRTPEPFRELLGERFKMEFGHGSVNSYEEFCAWVRGSASSVNASRHDLESVTWCPLRGNEYEAVFVLDWLGLNKDDKTMAAKTKHTWTFSDDPADAYPRIQHMDVQFLEPFSLIE